VLGHHNSFARLAARLRCPARFARYEWVDWRAISVCPGYRGGAVKLVVAGIVAAFLLFYIITSPDQAATIVHGTWHVAVNVAHGVGGFLNKLAS